MSEPLNVAVNKTDTGTVVEVSGWLDGHATLPDLGFISGTLTINLYELSFINSLGIRDWVDWIKNVRTEKGIILTRCSPPFVRQISILQNFIPHGVTVQSICVPYYCDQCEREERRLIEIGTLLDSLPADIQCVMCKGDMAMDVIKHIYFKFLEKQAG